VSPAIVPYSNHELSTESRERVKGRRGEGGDASGRGIDDGGLGLVRIKQNHASTMATAHHATNTSSTASSEGE
jgi:hypothetical protein